MNRVRALGLAGLAGISALVLAACSGTSGYGTAAPAAPATQTAGAQLTASTSSLGTIVVDGRGMTLYRFDKDTAKPSASNCTGPCAEEWPPVIVASGEPRLTGVSASEVGTVTRADGSRQLTIGGWPVYEYAEDSAPGDVKGEGVGGTWFAVSPHGKKVQPASTQTTTTSSGYSYGGGY